MVGPTRLVIVRGNDPALFESLATMFDGEPVRIICDRRAGERRRQNTPVAVERRRGDRRREPPTSWETSGFVIVWELTFLPSGQASPEGEGELTIAVPASAGSGFR